MLAGTDPGTDAAPTQDVNTPQNHVSSLMLTVGTDLTAPFVAVHLVGILVSLLIPQAGMHLIVASGRHPCSHEGSCTPLGHLDEDDICTLSSACASGVASTVKYFLNNGDSCVYAWKYGVQDNAGSSSTHKKCPDSAGSGTSAWNNEYYR